EVRAWTLDDGGGRLVGRTGGHVADLAFAGDVVVSAEVEGTITWWSAPPVVRGVPGPVRALAASADGTRVAVATAGGPIYLYDGAGTELAILAGNDAGTETIAFSPAGGELA